jgi:hypothetical protein
MPTKTNKTRIEAVVVRTKGTDPRTTRYLQPDNTWGVSSTALTFKTFKLAELHLSAQNLQADGYPVKIVRNTYEGK